VVLLDVLLSLFTVVVLLDVLLSAMSLCCVIVRRLYRKYHTSCTFLTSPSHTDDLRRQIFELKGSLEQFNTPQLFCEFSKRQRKLFRLERELKTVSTSQSPVERPTDIVKQLLSNRFVLWFYRLGGPFWSHSFKMTLSYLILSGFTLDALFFTIPIFPFYPVSPLSNVKLSKVNFSIRYMLVQVFWTRLVSELHQLIASSDRSCVAGL